MLGLPETRITVKELASEYRDGNRSRRMALSNYLIQSIIAARNAAEQERLWRSRRHYD